MPWTNTPDDRRRSGATYSTPEYRRNREAARRRANGCCEGCHHRHSRLECDHIRNTGGGPPDHSLGNLQMLCKGAGTCQCHERKTASEGGGFRSGRRHTDPELQPRTQWLRLRRSAGVSEVHRLPAHQSPRPLTPRPQTIRGGSHSVTRRRGGGFTVSDDRMVTVGLTALPDLPAAQSIVAAMEETIGALSCPKSDAAVVALARKVAATIDAMPDGQAGMMLGQTAPLLLKVLQELEDRARKRRSGPRASKPTGVAKLRAAHAQTVAKRTRAG